MSFKIGLPMRDGQGRTTSKTVHYAGTPATEDADSQAFLAKLSAVSDVGVVKTVATEQRVYIANANKLAADPQANRDEGITLSVTLSDGSGSYLKIPCPKRDANGLFVYVVNGTVDITNADILAYVGQFAVSGFNGQATAGKFTLDNGKQIASLDSGVLD